MNLKDFYSQTQAMTVLEMNFKMQINRWRKKIHPILGNRKPYWIDVCNKPFYLRSDIDQFMINLYRGKKERLRFEKNRHKQLTYDLDLDLWIPACEALEFINYGHDTLYRMTSYKSNPVHFIEPRRVMIGTKLFIFFNKADLQHFLVEGKTPYDERIGKEVWKPSNDSNNRR